MYHEILIIGAGPSGILAAITAKDMGKDVALLEGKDRICKKLLVTGNGRCNISNTNIEFSRYHSENNAFFENTLNSFTYKDTKDFFYSLGLPLTTLDEGKIFPYSLQASSVVDILRMTLEEKNIPLYLNSKIDNIQKTKEKFNITTKDGENFSCKKLILACGGKSYSNLGSDGSGYNIANSLDHNIVPPIPSLVQLKLNYNHLKALSGVKFNGFASIIIDNQLIKKDFGEILFTDYGISGPPILQLSRIASKALLNKKRSFIEIDLMPNKSKENLIDFLENHWGMFNYRSVHESFIGIINKKIIPILLKEANIDNIHKPCYMLSWKEKDNIYNLLKNWTFEIIGTNGFNNAQVTAGGINTLDVDPITLESKIIPNLFFCGEILDVDGDCGGFNLQWAWSSGFTAGKHSSL